MPRVIWEDTLSTWPRRNREENPGGVNGGVCGSPGQVEREPLLASFQ
jgi:hypothetical protein